MRTEENFRLAISLGLVANVEDYNPSSPLPVEQLEVLAFMSDRSCKVIHDLFKEAGIPYDPNIKVHLYGIKPDERGLEIVLKSLITKDTVLPKKGDSRKLDYLELIRGFVPIQGYFVAPLVERFPIRVTELEAHIPAEALKRYSESHAKV